MTVDTQKGVTVASCICSCGMNCQSFHWLSEVSGVWVCEIHICAVVIEGKIERNLFRLQPFFFFFWLPWKHHPSGSEILTENWNGLVKKKKLIHKKNKQANCIICKNRKQWYNGRSFLWFCFFFSCVLMYGNAIALVVKYMSGV